MSLVQVLLILVAIGLAQSKNVEQDENLDAPKSKLSALFDVERSSESPLVDKKNSVCDTDACKIIADEFKRGMNVSVAPCDDFYDFMCGAWENENKIPGYEAVWSRFHIFQDTVNRRIKSILEKEPETTDILPVRQAKKWYRACMDTDAIEKRGIKPLESILLQVGGWPMTLDPQEWNEDEHSWQSVEHNYFHITGSFVFYKFQPSWRDNSIIELEKGSIPLYGKLAPKYRNYTGDDYEAYTDFIAAVTHVFVEYNKAAVTDEMIHKDVEDLVEFEKQLYMLDASINDKNSETTIGEFVEWYNTNVTNGESDDKTKKIDFKNLIRRQFDLVNRQINDSVPLIVDHESYYVQLTEILNSTPSRTIVNYLHWYFVSDMLIYTTDMMREAYFQLLKNEFDVKERSPRWLECIKEMKMNTAAAYAFVQEYYSQEVEDAAQKIIQNIRQEMNLQIEASTWLDEESKTIVHEKLNEMQIFIGFPDWYKNRTYVSNAYKGLTIGHDHFDNVLSFTKYEMKKKLRYSDSELQYQDVIGGEEPIIVNAFYNPFSNNVVLPAADFQPPLFTSRVPQSVNYGIVGLAIGHEIGHGFDDSGFLLGKDGNKTKLSKKMLELFNERAECFLKQFNEYFGVTGDEPSILQISEDGYPDMPSRGLITRSDNMADSTGLQAVYKAFRKFNVNSTERFNLPGFEEYTDDQMFFISFGAMWCESVTPKFSEKRAMMDSHSPGRLRVIGTLSNLDDFAQTFNCPKGSFMNPDTKCNVWK